MITLNEEMIKTFIRLQLITQKPINDIISSTVIVCNNIFTEEQIRLIIKQILDDNQYKNTEVIDKLLIMVKEYVIDDYFGLNVDEFGMDEADRMIMDIICSIGKI